jgi:Ran GTPase-activating protein (RanGAP) involved in mRNA processing and transport
VSEVLAHNLSIHYLNLARNPLKDEGAMAVAEALRSNIHLFKLDLSGCALGPEGCIALAGALKVNMVLSHLNLSNTSIGRAALSVREYSVVKYLSGLTASLCVAFRVAW